MTPKELTDIIRSEYLDEFLDDATSELISESSVKNKSTFLLREIGRGQRQACWRGDMRRIFDDSTAAICTLTLVEDTRYVTLDRRVLRIESAVPSWTNTPLAHTTLANLESRYPGWRDWQSGQPNSFYIMGRKLFFDKTPSSAEADYTVTLSVWREPLVDPEWHDDLEVELDGEAIAHWVAHRALSRPNQDKARFDLAKYHLDAFNAYYGNPISLPARNDILALPPVTSFGPLDPPRSQGRKRVSRFDYDYGV